MAENDGSGAAEKLTFLLIGAGIGATLALLFAPKSGRELRGDIADYTKRGVDAAVEENRVFDFVYRRDSAQPLAIFALWAVRLAMFDKTQRMSVHPGYLVGHAALSSFKAGVVSESRGPALFGAVIQERFIVGRYHIAHIPDNIHHFMITEADKHRATLPGRFVLQRHDEIQNSPAFRSPIHKVSELDKCGLSTCPLTLLIDQAGRLEDRHESIEVSVHVPHSDDSLALWPLYGGCKQQKGDSDSG